MTGGALVQQGQAAERGYLSALRKQASAHDLCDSVQGELNRAAGLLDAGDVEAAQRLLVAIAQRLDSYDVRVAEEEQEDAEREAWKAHRCSMWEA